MWDLVETHFFFSPLDTTKCSKQLFMWLEQEKEFLMILKAMGLIIIWFSWPIFLCCCFGLSLEWNAGVLDVLSAFNIRPSQTKTQTPPDEFLTGEFVSQLSYKLTGYLLVTHFNDSHLPPILKCTFYLLPAGLVVLCMCCTLTCTTLVSFSHCEF